MKMIKRIGIPAAILVLLVVIIEVNSSRVQAQGPSAGLAVQVVNSNAIPVLDTFHLAANIVELRCIPIGTAGFNPCLGISSDGNIFTSDYKVPSSMSLVITSVDLEPQNPTQFNQASIALIVRRNGSTFQRGGWFFGPGNEEYQFPNGIVIAPGSEVNVEQLSGPFENEAGFPPNYVLGVRGYLSPAPVILPIVP